MWNVLIADDELAERRGIEALLRRRNLPVQIWQASNGEEALALLKKQKIDLLISDVKMPKLSGLELTELIRQTDEDMIIIIQSAYDDFEYMRRAIRMRVDDYILKPVVISEFDATIDAALKTLEQKRGSGSPREHGAVEEVCRLIEGHYGENIGLEWLAERVELSANYLSSLFKSETGQGLTQYLCASRMEKAKQLLLQTNLRISEIGQRVGYPNTSYFCQQFKKFFGVTANSMRENRE